MLSGSMFVVSPLVLGANDNDCPSGALVCVYVKAEPSITKIKKRPYIDVSISGTLRYTMTGWDNQACEDMHGKLGRSEAKENI